MLKMFGFLVVALAVAAGAVVAYAATKPDRFRVSRSLAIAAPPDRLFAFVDDLRAFNRWNPYERKGPVEGTYSGPPSGVGASYAWDGAKVGKGEMTITGTDAPTTVVMRLDFQTPFKATNIATFAISPRDGGSEITWTMEGPAPIVTKVMDTIIGMDRMIGRDFEDGLRHLKSLAEPS